MKPEQTPAANDGSLAAGHPRSSTALLVLLFGLGGVVLYFARAAFIPIAFSLLFTLLLSSPVEALYRRGLPRSVGAILILMMVLGLIGGAINLLWCPAQQGIAAAPRTIRTIERKLGPLATFVHRIDVVIDRAGRVAAAGAAVVPPAATPVPSPSAAGGLLVATRTALVGVTTVAILTLFLLAAGPAVLARMAAALASETWASEVLRILEAVRSEVGRYYATIAMINLGLGVATALLMTALRLPNAIRWGVLAGVLNFIPYLGSATTLVVLSMVAFVSFDSIGRVAAVAVSYLSWRQLKARSYNRYSWADASP